MKGSSNLSLHLLTLILRKIGMEFIEFIEKLEASLYKGVNEQALINLSSQF